MDCLEWGEQSVLDRNYPFGELTNLQFPHVRESLEGSTQKNDRILLDHGPTSTYARMVTAAQMMSTRLKRTYFSIVANAFGSLRG